MAKEVALDTTSTARGDMGVGGKTLVNLTPPPLPVLLLLLDCVVFVVSDDCGGADGSWSWSCWRCSSPEPYAPFIGLIIILDSSLLSSK